MQTTVLACRVYVQCKYVKAMCTSPHYIYVNGRKPTRSVLHQNHSEQRKHLKMGIPLTHEPLGGIKLPPLRFVKYLRNLMSYERETWHSFK